VPITSSDARPAAVMKSAAPKPVAIVAIAVTEAPICPVKCKW
jgi:hypothetical protein